MTDQSRLAVPDDEARGEVARDARVDGVVLTPDQERSRRNRNIAIGLAVAFFVLLFYVVTIAKLGPGVLKRPM